ncbi:hypothetical protein [Lentzea fradiae]|uniref:hypothetical protein n=1 Tax=Lentzea fradiae TaxID=200378 RepID=UPI0015A2D3E9|nr:hypothetical protein [Lentzea fradiae]
MPSRRYTSRECAKYSDGAWSFVPAVQAALFQAAGEGGELAVSFAVSAFNIGIVALGFVIALVRYVAQREPVTSGAKG